MDSESKTSHSIRPLPPRPRLPKRRSFSRALFLTPSNAAKKTKVVVSSNVNGDPRHTTSTTTTFYGDDKRIIHTGYFMATQLTTTTLNQCPQSVTNVTHITHTAS
ncbi:hypothetical protein CR513_47536, partial [Mucuna pruriens]